MSQQIRFANIMSMIGFFSAGISFLIPDIIPKIVVIAISLLWGVIGLYEGGD